LFIVLHESNQLFPGTADLSGTDVAEDDTVQLPAPKLEHKIYQI